jgi:hypothetical protein
MSGYSDAAIGLRDRRTINTINAQLGFGKMLIGV